MGHPASLLAKDTKDGCPALSGKSKSPPSRKRREKGGAPAKCKKDLMEEEYA